MGATGLTPEPVAGQCHHWLSLIDRRAPGLVTGLHLRGGLAFGEWFPGTSDIDFVVTTARRPDDRDLAALRESHAELGRLHPGTAFDGVHLLADDLARDPSECPDVPSVLHGHFEAEGRDDLNPVAWHEVALGGVTLRGPTPAEIGVWTDDSRLRDFTLENLRTYWAQNADALQAMPREAEAPETCSWCVLGVARLHHLLETGTLTTKSGAGRWALTHYPDHFHRVVREALAVREGGALSYVGDEARRGVDTAAFVAHAVAAGSATSG